MFASSEALSHFVSATLLNSNNFLPDSLILLAIASVRCLIIATTHKPSSANVFSELACGQPSFKHLVNLLERAVLDFRQIKVHPDDCDEA